MIDGLKVTLTGEELRELLDERAAECRASAANWRRESERTSADATELDPLLPEHMCKNEAAHQEWRAGVLDLLRDRVDASEIYRLGRRDLKYVGFFPTEPEMFGPYDSEDSTDDASGLGPHAERVCMSPEIIMVTNPDVPKQ